MLTNFFYRNYYYNILSFNKITNTFFHHNIQDFRINIIIKARSINYLLKIKLTHSFFRLFNALLFKLKMGTHLCKNNFFLGIFWTFF